MKIYPWFSGCVSHWDPLRLWHQRHPWQPIPGARGRTRLQGFSSRTWEQRPFGYLSQKSYHRGHCQMDFQFGWDNPRILCSAQQLSLLRWKTLLEISGTKLGPQSGLIDMLAAFCISGALRLSQNSNGPQINANVPRRIKHVKYKQPSLIKRQILIKDAFSRIKKHIYTNMGNLELAM